MENVALKVLWKCSLTALNWPPGKRCEGVGLEKQVTALARRGSTIGFGNPQTRHHQINQVRPQSKCESLVAKPIWDGGKKLKAWMRETCTKKAFKSNWFEYKALVKLANCFSVEKILLTSICFQARLLLLMIYISTDQLFSFLPTPISAKASWTVSRLRIEKK